MVPAARLEEAAVLATARAHHITRTSTLPFYRRVMDELGLTPPPSGPPPTCRSACADEARIRSAGETLLADNVRRTALRPMVTSGSTGEPLCFTAQLKTSSRGEWPPLVQCPQMGGISIGDRHATLSRARHYASVRNNYLNDLSLRVRRSESLDYGSLTDATWPR